MDDADEAKDDLGVKRISKNKLRLKNKEGGDAAKIKKYLF